jgi:tetratricopeptide (TPR) repeat protein
MKGCNPQVIVVITTLLLAGCSEAERKQSYFDRGMALYQAGNTVKARLEFRNVLQIDPKHPQAWLMLARIAEQQNDPRAAFGAYEKAAQLDPENAQLRLKWGEMLLGANRVEDALSEAENVLAKAPASADALALRAAVRNRQNDQAAAVADALAALEAEPGHRNALSLLAGIRLEQGDSHAAKGLMEEAVETYPEDVALRYSLAAVYKVRGEMEAARAAHEALIALEPQILAHRQALADFLTEQGQTAAAENALRTAVAENPDQTDAKLLLAQYAANQRGTDAGVAVFEELIAAESDEYRLRFALADLYRAAGRPADAESTYRAIMERDSSGPQGLRARGLLAGLLLADDRPHEAEVLAAEALAGDPRDAEALLVRAAIALQGGNTEQAISDLRLLLQDDPGSTRALRLLAKAHAAREEVALAQDALQTAIEAAPSEPAAYLQLVQLRMETGDTEGASLILEQLLAQAPRNAQAQDALARIQFAKQDWQAMENTAERVLKTRPEHFLGYYLKGQVMQRTGRLKESVAAFETALEKAPEAVAPLLALARSRMALSQPEQAEDRIRQVLAADPMNAPALNLLGQLQAALQRPDAARTQFERAIEAQPTSPIAYSRLAGLQAQGGDYSAAIETLRKGIEATQGNAFLHFRLAVVLQQAGRFEEAAAAYEEVLQAAPDLDAAVNNLALLLAEHRADDAASLDRALELMQRYKGSDQPVFLDTLGWVYFRRGDYEQAAATLERVAELRDPLPAEVQYHLGMTYARLGRIGEAKTLLSSAVNAGRTFPGIEEAREALSGF